MEPSKVTEGQEEALMALDSNPNIIVASSVAHAREVVEGTSEPVQIRLKDGLNEGELEELAELVIENHTNFVGLDLAGSKIGDLANLACFTDALGKNSSLRALYLGSNRIGSTIDDFVTALKTNKALLILDLYNNGLGDEGCEPLADLLEVNNTLQKLNLANNVMGSNSGTRLARSLRKNKGLRVLNLWNNSIGDDGAKEFAAVLQHSKTLEALILFFNGITSQGGIELADALKANHTIKWLNLGRNKLGVAAGERLAASLKENTKIPLEHLDLFGGEIEDQGASALFRAILANKHLRIRTLRLARNLITKHCTQDIVDLLSDKRIRNVNLMRNKIDQGLEDVARLLDGRAVHLRSLSVLGNMASQTSAKIKAEIGTAFVRAMFNNETLHELEVANNQFGGECEKLLHSFISPNRRTKEDIIFSALFDVELCLVDEPLDVATVPRNESNQPFDRRHIQRLVWSQGAFRMAKQNMFLFVQCLEFVNRTCLESRETDSNVSGSTAEYWSNKNLWLMKDPNTNIPFIHDIFLCDFGVAGFCQFIDENIDVSIMLELLNSQDGNKRNLRAIARVNQDTYVSNWAKSYGTFLKRYQIDDGPPVHVSKSCVVCFATDITSTDEVEKKVSLKIMRRREDFVRELESRSIKVQELERKDVGNVIEDSDFKQENFRYTIPILAVHLDQKCIVMERADRSLFETMHTERIAGQDVARIRTIARCLAHALLELKKHERIHGDVKPRNMLRMSKLSSDNYFVRDEGIGKVFDTSTWQNIDSENSMVNEDNESWKLIDLDASVAKGASLADKCSTAYVPPELAVELFTTPQRGESNIAPDLKADYSFDVWSFGVVLFELLSGTPLFLMDKTNDNIVSSTDMAGLVNWLVIDKDRLDRIPEIDKYDHQAAVHLIQRCLVGDPTQRISIEEVCSHPFIVGIEPTRTNRAQRPRKLMVAQSSRRLLEPDSFTSSAKSSAAQNQTASSTSSTRSSGAAPAAPRKATSSRFSRFLPKLGFRKKTSSTTTSPSSTSTKGSRKTMGEPTQLQEQQQYPIQSQSAMTVSRSGRDSVPREVNKHALEKYKKAVLGLSSALSQVDIRFHFFFSHAQKEASGIVKDLFLNCRENQCTSWLDVLADDLTEPGMRDGVQRSKVFVFVLTRTVLFRPYCVKELFWAVKEGKTVICIEECDERFFSFHDAFLPWNSEDEVRQLVAKDPVLFNAAETENPQDIIEEHVDWFREQKKTLMRGLDTHGKDMIRTIQRKFPRFTKLPYRRRAYESQAMINALLESAQISSPSQIRQLSSSPDTMPAGSKKTLQRQTLIKKEILIVFQPSAIDMAEEFAESLRKEPVFIFNGSKMSASVELDAGGELLQKVISSDDTQSRTVVLFLITNGVFDAHPGLASALQEWWCNRNGRVVCVHSLWEFGGSEESSLKADSPVLFSKLFVDTEILPIRRNEGERAYEHEAMVKEVRARLVDDRKKQQQK